MTISPKEARQARAFLQKKGIPSSAIPPKSFAATAKKMGKSFAEVLKLIAKLQMGGQGEGQAPEANEIAKKEAERK